VLYGKGSATNSGNQPEPGSLPGTFESQPLPSKIGAWSVPGMLCASDQACLIGANAAVLPSAKVLFYYYPPPTGTNSNALVLDPQSGEVTDVTLPFAIDIFCSGMSFMPNGQLLVTGGFMEGTSVATAGIFNATIFQPRTSTWSMAQNMNYARWYPSTVELPDGTMLALSGIDNTGRVRQKVMETYNYKTNTWTVLPASANMPSNTLHYTAYPRMTVLPSGLVFLSAPDTESYEFNPSTNTWSYVATNNFGFRFYAPHVLLPGLEKVLVAGGTLVESPSPGTATNTAEVIDFSVGSPAWSYTAPMTYARVNHNLVLLADGTVLAVGGGGGNGAHVSPVFTPELYNPTTGTWTLMAPQIVPRTYHSTAVLLADGRVLSAGANDRGSMQETYEIFSPPYLFQGPRPVISSVPASLSYGANFTVTTPDAASIVRMALVKPGATTHADNFDQRYVDLTFTIGSGQITATAPASGNYAPPGSYMLVIVNSSGVPSVMRFLTLI
jgi:galactose oxidase-like protein/glyoxal oxidase-like protein